MTVRELLDRLAVYPAESLVIATWEGVFREIDVYASAGGTVVIDADGGFYKERITRGIDFIPPNE